MGFVQPVSNDWQISAKAVENLLRELRRTDDVAFYNVTHDDKGKSILGIKVDFSDFKLKISRRPAKGKFPRGGPFGSEIVILLPNGKVEVIGEARGNNVIGSGIASWHAEDRALQADNYEKLVNRLIELKAQGVEPMVWVVSSGQSCPNCHTKEEIMARDLIEIKKLVKPDQFKVLYGATFDDTFRIAQFYDAQYADAMILFSRDPKHPGNLIRHDRIKFADVPAEVQQILQNATGPTAVIVRDGKIHAVGTDKRTEYSLYSTAEVNAVQEACIKNRNVLNEFESWKGGGELYTTSGQVGPLLFAELSWTGMNKVHSVEMPAHLLSKQFQTRETPGLQNADFLKIIAGGYDHPDAAMQVVLSGSHDNRSQRMWAEFLKVNDKALYNGAAVSNDVLAMRDQYTRFRFAAGDICSHCIGALPQMAQPLKNLAEFKPSGVD